MVSTDCHCYQKEEFSKIPHGQAHTGQVYAAYWYLSILTLATREDTLFLTKMFTVVMEWSNTHLWQQTLPCVRPLTLFDRPANQWCWFSSTCCRVVEEGLWGLLERRDQQELQLRTAACQGTPRSFGEGEGKLAPSSLLEVWVNLKSLFLCAPHRPSGTQVMYNPVVVVKVPFLKKMIPIIFWLLHTPGSPGFLVTFYKLSGLSGLTDVKYQQG